jgi:hypothetical protein
VSERERERERERESEQGGGWESAARAASRRSEIVAGAGWHRRDTGEPRIKFGGSHSSETRGF